MRRSSVMLAAVVTCGAGSSFGQAQVPETQPGVVVVTPTRDERMLADVPASVSVVTREQIRGTPGDSIDDVIRTVPGLETTVASSYQLHPTSSFPSMLGTKNG